MDSIDKFMWLRTPSSKLMCWCGTTDSIYRWPSSPNRTSSRWKRMSNSQTFPKCLSRHSTRKWIISITQSSFCDTIGKRASKYEYKCVEMMYVTMQRVCQRQAALSTGPPIHACGRSRITSSKCAAAAMRAGPSKTYRSRRGCLSCECIRTSSPSMPTIKYSDAYRRYTTLRSRCEKKLH